LHEPRTFSLRLSVSADNRVAPVVLFNVSLKNSHVLCSFLVTEQEQEKIDASPPFYGVDTGFPPMLSTIYFRQFIQILINVFFIPEDLRKDFLGWDRKFTGIKFIPDRLRPQTYIIGQFIEIHHSFFKLFHHAATPKGAWRR
jgi:hypothetical protein